MTNRTLVLAAVCLLGVMTFAHYAMNVSAYYKQYAYIIPFLYLVSLWCLYYIGRLTKDFVSHLLIYGSITAIKICLLSARGDESRIHEFSPMMHTLAAKSMPEYYAVHDIAALVLVLIIGYVTAKRA